MSLDLYLVRHAIAEDRDPERWPDDRLRPLTEKGIARFTAAARGLRRLAPRVEIVLSSPLTRARQTAEILAARAGWPAAQLLAALAPETAPAETVAALQSFLSARTLALVGHEPHLSTLAGYLLTGTTSWPILELRKGGAALLHFADHLVPGGATLRWLLPPRVLRRLE
ncbi:MAG: phosphohistidine phosphatase SixA [Dehalococcoidia bacterium]|nr:MAG: phosphohistidine phosphatase SixA [Dehalococcoidia bacterium]